MLVYEFVAENQDVGRKLWRHDIVHLLVVDEDLGRQSFQNPDMFKRLIRAKSLSWVPLQAFLDKIGEVGVLVTDHKPERFTHRLA